MYPLSVAFEDPLFLVACLFAVAIVAAMFWSAPRRAQPRLPFRDMILRAPDGVASVRLSVEVAHSIGEQRIGLMFRSSVPKNTGMLFRWGRASRAAVWMRNVRVPLDLVFLSAQDSVVAVVRRTPGGWAMSGMGFRSAGLIELPAGTCRREGIVPGWLLVPGSRTVRGLPAVAVAPGLVSAPGSVGVFDAAAQSAAVAASTLTVAVEPAAPDGPVTIAGADRVSGVVA